jgi:N-acetylmuramate 1-kinase
MAAPDSLNREAAMRHFLAESGWGQAQVAPLAGDASFRRYFRVAYGERWAILMDAPPDKEDVRPFVAIAQGLLAQGFHAPHIYAQDAALGFVLLQDFGQERMKEYVEAWPEQEESFYKDTVNLLKVMHKQPPLDVPPYDAATYARELELFLTWYCPALGLHVDAEGFWAIWQELLDGLLQEQAAHPVTVLRDYHAENIMRLEGGALGLLDFQDALAGHKAYDMVSILQDARRDVSLALAENMLGVYTRDMEDRAAFTQSYYTLGAQRNIKILGIFTRLWQRDDKPHYKAFQPRVWGYLDICLAQPHLHPLKTWFEENVPAPARAAAWRENV